MDWYLEERDDFQKYEEYRWLLQVFQSEAPEQRLTMKTPAHTGNLKQIKRAIPQAMIIQTHRDPSVCVSSVCSLGVTFYRAATDQVDIRQIADQTVHLYDIWLRRNIAFRESHPGAVYDVHYQSLVSDPVGTVRDIYAHYDLPWTRTYEKVLEEFVQRNPKNKHGQHRYAASDFGLDDAELVLQFQFYTDYVGLSPR
jgi:hypothetical protein